MKKLLIAGVALGCAAAVIAQTATSQNIVGYKKNVLPTGGFLIIAPAQFAGTAGGISVDDAISGVVGGEKIFIFNGTAYDSYSYYAGYGWFSDGGDPGGPVVIPEGQSLWMTGVGGSETITAGEVPSAASVTISVVAGFNLIANPYPVDLAIGDIDLTDFVGGEKVFLFNGTAYDSYTYYAGYGWFSDGGDPGAAVKVPVGEGFWLSMVNPGSLVFNKTF